MELCKKKQRHLTEFEKLVPELGDWWIWSAFEPMLKVLVSFVAGKRNIESAKKLVGQVKERSDGHIPLFTSDELSHYEEALKETYSIMEEPSYSGKGRPPKRELLVPDPSLDYAQVVKTREKGRVVRVETRVILGEESRIKEKLDISTVSNEINTSFVERHNAHWRQECRRLTRKTYAFSRRADMLEGHMYLISATYHFCHYHHGLRTPLPVQTERRKWAHRTPAMAAGLTDHRWTVMELLKYPTISN